MCYARWLVSPEPRDPPDEASFCALFKVTVEDLAMFETDWKFSDRIQAAVPHRWFKEVGHTVQSIYHESCKASGAEKAFWMDAFLRLTAPRLAERDIFSAWKAAPPPKPSRAARK